MSKSVEISYSSLIKSCKTVMNSRRHEKLVRGNFPLGKKEGFCFLHIFALKFPRKCLVQRICIQHNLVQSNNVPRDI